MAAGRSRVTVAVHHLEAGFLSVVAGAFFLGEVQTRSPLDASSSTKLLCPAGLDTASPPVIRSLDLSRIVREET